MYIYSIKTPNLLKNYNYKTNSAFATSATFVYVSNFIRNQTAAFFKNAKIIYLFYIIEML